MNEEWNVITGTSGRYEVSDLGGVRRVSASRGARVGHILKPQKGGRGHYRKVVLGGKGARRAYVHQLVAEAFLPPRPSPLHEPNHKNGDTTDNRAANLEWMTRAENNTHAYRVLGKKAVVPLGESQWNAKLNELQVLAIRDLWASSRCSQSQLAAQFGVLQTTISRIVLRQSWKHI